MTFCMLRFCRRFPVKNETLQKTTRSALYKDLT